MSRGEVIMIMLLVIALLTVVAAALVRYGYTEGLFAPLIAAVLIVAGMSFSVYQRVSSGSEREYAQPSTGVEIANAAVAAQEALAEESKDFSDVFPPEVAAVTTTTTTIDTRVVITRPSKKRDTKVKSVLPTIPVLDVSGVSPSSTVPTVGPVLSKEILTQALSEDQVVDFGAYCFWDPENGRGLLVKVSSNRPPLIGPGDKDNFDVPVHGLVQFSPLDGQFYDSAHPAYSIDWPNFGWGWKGKGRKLSYAFTADLRDCANSQLAAG